MIVVMYTSPQVGVLFGHARSQEEVPAVLSRLRCGDGGRPPQLNRATRVVSVVGTTIYLNNLDFHALEKILAGQFTEMKDFFVTYPITPEVAELTGIVQATLGATITCINDSALCRRIEHETHVQRLPTLRRHDARSINKILDPHPEELPER